MTSSDEDPLKGETPPVYEEPEASTSAGVAQKNQPLRKGERREDDEPAVAPPEFTDFRANITLTALGDVVTHDEHLNEDAEALFRFILLHTKQAPELWVSIKGEHDEQRTEHHKDAQGKHHVRHTTHTVTDFAFEVPVRTDHDARGRLYIVPPELPAWRGRGFLRRGGALEGAIALPSDLEANQARAMTLRGSKMGVRARRKADNLWRAFRKRGLCPYLPWTVLQHHLEHRTPYWDREGYQHPIQQAELDQLGEEVDPLIFDGKLVDREVRHMRLRAGPHSSLQADEQSIVLSAVREWCDVYCSETRPLKEFEVTKTLHGWAFARIEAALRNAVRQAPYPHRIHISWRQTSSSVRILPSSHLAKLFTLAWPLKLLLWLVLVYPVLLVLRALFLGAHFDVVRATYALTRWLPMPDVPPNAPEEDAARAALLRAGPGAKTARLKNANGDYEWWVLEGETEDAWLGRWRQSITSAVRNGVTGPLRTPA